MCCLNTCILLHKTISTRPFKKKTLEIKTKLLLVEKIDKYQPNTRRNCRETILYRGTEGVVWTLSILYKTEQFIHHNAILILAFNQSLYNMKTFLNQMEIIIMRERARFKPWLYLNAMINHCQYYIINK